MRRAPEIIALVAAAVLGCSDHSPTGPGVTPSVASVTISVGAPGLPSLTVGATTSVSATAVAGDGSRRSCTDTAVWRSSNPAVATFVPPFTLNAVGAGTTVLSATCSGVTASTLVAVYEAAALSGTVTSENGAPLPGVSLWVQDSKYGHSASTDAAGRYRLAGIVRGGSYPVSARKDGYETISTTITLGAAENVQDFRLTVGLTVGGRLTEAGVGPLAGVTVAIVSGVNAGQTTVGTSWGAYGFQHLQPGRFTLRATKAGYEAAEQTIETSVNANVDFALKASYGACLISVNPLVIEEVPSAGGAAAIEVNAAAGRTWFAASDQPWVEAPATGWTGPATVPLRILPAAPGATDYRTAVVRVGCGPTEGQGVRVSQAPDCRTSVTWAADSPTTFGAAGGVGRVVVKTGTPGCHWRSISRSEWITPVGVRDWFGDVETAFIVQPNATGAPRVGLLVIGERQWEVRQGR
jgi:hypothetical protein